MDAMKLEALKKSEAALNSAGTVKPQVGQGLFWHVGSDQYGTAVKAVADDLTWIQDEEGDFHKLCLQKRSKAFGKYIRCKLLYPQSSYGLHDPAFVKTYCSDPKNWEPMAPWSSRGTRYYNICCVSPKICRMPTILDPSF